MADISKIKLPSSTTAYIIKDSVARQMIAQLPSPMVFKGTLGTGGTITALPTAAASNNGWTYKVITAGTYASIAAKVGDMFISNGTKWEYVPSGDEPSGTVTNIATGTGLTGGPITSSGTIAIDSDVIADREEVENMIAEGVAASASYTDNAISLIPDATTSVHGYMSTADKTKLNGIATGANKYVHPTYTSKSSGLYKVTVDGTGHVSDATAVVKSDITSLGIPAQDTTYNDATTSAHGLMTAADKTKLNSIASGAEVNQNAFSNIVVGSTTIEADSKTDSLNLVAGSNITLTPDATNDKITISATDTITTVTTTGSGNAITSLSATNGAITATKGSTFLTSHQDISGKANVSETGYSLAVSGKTVSLKNKDGDVLNSITTQDTTYSSKEAASGGTAVSLVTTGEKYTWNNKANTSVATTSANGLMSSSDKTKLDGIASGAEVNQNAFSNVIIGSTTISADSKTDSLTLVAGSNVTLTPDATNDKVTIAATDTVYTHPSSHPASMITGLATVATSGSYSDLSNKPTINNQTVKGNGTEFSASDAIDIVGGGATTVTADTTNKKITISSTNTTYGVVSTSANGLAPKVTDTTKYLRGDGTWATPTNTTYSTMTGATSSAAGTSGLVPAPAAGKQTSFLRGDGTWVVPTNTTYTFDGTYNASTNKAATVSTVTNAIAALDGTVSGDPGASKTLTAFSETDGKVSATFEEISITKSQVSDLGTIGAAAAKGVVTSVDTSANLPTSNAVKTYADGKIANPSTKSSGQFLKYDGSSWVSSTVDKSTVGLGNVENKSSATIRSEISSSNVTTALGYTPLNSNLKGANSGLAELDANGKVPSAQLPSYVDDVLEYDKQSSFPTTGEAGKIYIAKDTNKTYRWSGTAYVEISASLALGTTSSTAYYGDKGKIAYDHSQASHARTDATATAASTTNGNIKINGTETTVYTHPSSHAASMITGLATVATSGSYNDLSNKPTIDNNNQKITGNSTAFGANDTINIVGGGATTVTGDATNKKITISSTNTTYSDMTAATSSAAGVHGLVPAPASGKQDSFLRGNATWADASTILNTLSTGSSNPSDADYYISQYAGGGATTTTYHRRPMSALWEYIKGKISSVLGLTASSYNGKAATAGTADSATSATTATKLGSTTVGGTTTPIYLKSGAPTALSYTIAKSVPSDAKFTDTTYSAATTSAAGLMSAADKTKLDGIAEGATNVTTSTVSGWGYTKTTGTVTKVATGTGLAGGPITSSGTISVDTSVIATRAYAIANPSNKSAGQCLQYDGSNWVASSLNVSPVEFTITGDGQTKSFTVNHTFNTRNTSVIVYDQNYDDIIVGINRSSTNSVVIKFASAPEQGVSYTVLVTPIGILGGI